MCCLQLAGIEPVSAEGGGNDDPHHEEAPDPGPGVSTVLGIPGAFHPLNNAINKQNHL